MITPSSFAIHVTYTCPLACAHCCFVSGPAVKDTLSAEYIIECIEALPDDIKMVAFTGGEPFLHGSRLALYVQHAKKRGFTTRIVTSAYFGASRKNARKRIEEVKNAGLDELSISWDDFHSEFISFNCVKNVIEAAIGCGVSPAINSVQVLNSFWTRDRIVSELGMLSEYVNIVTETHLNITGRAEEKLVSKDMKPNGFLGPCPYALTGPTLSAKGHLLACCGVIPHSNRLVIAENPRAQEISAHIESSLSNPLLLWLFLRGPYALIVAIATHLNIDPPDPNKIGGNCEACRILFNNSAFDSCIDFVLSEKLMNIASELLLLDSLGLLKADAIQNLWVDRSLTRIGL